MSWTLLWILASVPAAATAVQAAPGGQTTADLAGDPVGPAAASPGMDPKPGGGGDGGEPPHREPEASRDESRVPPEPPTEASESPLAVRFGEVTVSAQVLGDVAGGYEEPRGAGEAHGAFALGTAELFVVAALGDHLQVLTEVVAEGESEGEGEGVGIDLERLWASYRLSDLLYFKLGREHSPVSRWDRLYSHGKLYWPAATQPFLARFEDDGGVLPVHFVGIEAGGALSTRAGALDYVLAVSNGRAGEPDAVQAFGDSNEEKAATLSLGFSPAVVPGLRAGVGFSADVIPSDGEDPVRGREIGEWIGGASVEVVEDGWNSLAEIAFVQHEERGTDRVFRHRSGYVQLGYRAGRWNPYARFDLRSMARGDPFYRSVDIDLDAWEQTVGLGIRFGDSLILRVEGGMGKAEWRDEESASVAKRTTGRAVVQVAWGF